MRGLALDQRAADESDRDRQRIVVAENEDLPAFEIAMLQHQYRAQDCGLRRAGRLIESDVDRRRPRDDGFEALDLGHQPRRNDDAASGAGRAQQIMRYAEPEHLLDEGASFVRQRKPMLALQQPGLFELAPDRGRDRQRQPRFARRILQPQRSGAVDRAQHRRDAGRAFAQPRRARDGVEDRGIVHAGGSTPIGRVLPRPRSRAANACAMA